MRPRRLAALETLVLAHSAEMPRAHEAALKLACEALTPAPQEGEADG